MTQQPQGRKSLLPHFLATLYGLAIVYASLQPFLNWMEPVPGSPYFLFARWPPRWVRYDVIINILARKRDPQPAAILSIPDALRLTHEPLADCARYDSLRRAS